MELEMNCLRCGHDYQVCGEPNSRLNRLQETGPWFALGDGHTLEDGIHLAIMEDEEHSCPICGGPGRSNEESLGLFAQELLGRW